MPEPGPGPRHYFHDAGSCSERGAAPVRIHDIPDATRVGAAGAFVAVVPAARSARFLSPRGHSTDAEEAI